MRPAAAARTRAALARDAMGHLSYPSRPSPPATSRHTQPAHRLRRLPVIPSPPIASGDFPAALAYYGRGV
ncbi:MAG TPA: hypothetical protein VJM69_06000, partial [Dehalococcoidia bacterium]|nr:hypothetical protein [Dehalococcoidia bacterium]